MDSGNSGGSLVVDALVGAVAGAAAVWVMDRVDWFNFRHEDPRARAQTRAVRPGGMAPAHVLANRIGKAVGHEAQPKEDNAFGKSVHYSIGIVPGALYGALRHRYPALATGRGTLFGLSLFLLQDEGLNAVTGLSAKPQDYPWQAHARGFVAHATYGLVLETVLSLADSLRSR